MGSARAICRLAAFLRTRLVLPDCSAFRNLSARRLIFDLFFARFFSAEAAGFAAVSWRGDTEVSGDPGPKTGVVSERLEDAVHGDSYNVPTYVSDWSRRTASSSTPPHPSEVVLSPIL